MHISSYDFYFFSKKGMILYSWLPIQTYPKKMVSLKKKVPQNLVHFGPFFSTQKNPFHTLKLYMSGQKFDENPPPKNNQLSDHQL